MTTWHFVQTTLTGTEDGRTFSVPGDSFVVSEARLEALRAFFELRATPACTCTIADTRVMAPGTEVSFDLPGMYMQQPESSIAFDGLAVEIPISDVGPYLRILRAAPEEKMGDVVIYSMAGHLRWWIFSPEERERMLAALEAAAPDADAQAKAFWAKRESPAEVLRRANATALGIDEKELPELGGRTMEEFK